MGRNLNKWWIVDLLLHPVEQISPLSTKSVEGSAGVSVATSLSSHLTSHHQTWTNMIWQPLIDWFINWRLTCHLKPLQMCILFRHGAAQGLLSEVAISFWEITLTLISLLSIFSWLKSVVLASFPFVWVYFNNAITDGGSTAPQNCWYRTEEKTNWEHKRDWRDTKGIVGRRTSGEH